MFDSIESLQSFLTWCRDNGVTQIKVGDVSAVIDPNQARRDFSDNIMAAMIADDSNKKDKQQLEREPVDRELLFWSSGR